ncbi:site-specific integrase [Streptomyces harbinensis]|uniref:tyrosine-type recombinase/integrase n=1 Tax=Streptomyces harbinensis TaxID=1176198 RepID=UPI0015910C74|nr:site-specific integrase [Streptomyces harbinensis]QKV69914.1 site-specific integrase [Streptomyces harbinensis]
MGNKKGSRRRFGAVRQYRSGRWTASYLGTDGQEHRSPETFATKTDAEIWLSQVEADLSRGDWRDPVVGAVNFGEYAAEWVEDREISPTTEELYRRLLRLHLLPTFGGQDLDQITPPKVRAWRTERKKATGATTVAKSYRLLKAILETAADDELIRRNPCRIKGAGAEKPGERPIATVAQIDALADAMGPRWRAFVLLATYGPMRPEELAELRRSDVALTAEEAEELFGPEDDPGAEPLLGVWVRRAAPELTNGRRVLGDPKSKAGKRFIVLPAFLEKDLRRHLDWYAQEGPDGLLFVGERGAPFRRSTFGRKWRRALVVAGLPKGFRLYDTRHTGHNISTRSGATLKDTMVRAGQSSEKAAMIYQHSEVERQREVAAGIDASVRAARARASGANLVRKP